MKLKLTAITAITVYLNKAKKVLCVRCNFTGRFMKRIIGIKALNALQRAKQQTKKATLKRVYNTLAIIFYSLAILLPFVLCFLLNTNGMNLHDSIMASGLLSMFFSTILMLVGCQFSDSSLELTSN